MKRIITLILTAGLFFGSQVGMAAELSGLVVTDKFNDELSAVDRAKNIISEIEAGTNKAVVSTAADRCQNLRKVAYDSKGFSVTPVWVEKDNGFQKEYSARINYRIFCDLKVNVGSL
ncbi:hypothetical protein KJ966_26515 [bacterium]|nr:hypothetical protein [bacterium]